jgi:acetyltransferase-like isoleucine patch superfamily enzyme
MKASLKTGFQRTARSVLAFVEYHAHAATSHEQVRNGVLTIGRHTYGRPKVRSYAGDGARVIIGSFCSIAPEVQFIPGGIHPKDWVSLYPFRVFWGMPGAFQDGMPTKKGDIVVGCDVWFGTRAMILSGVNIGHGAIVSAGAIVTRDVPPYAVVGGCPAKVIGHRFNPDIIAEMLAIAWWEWADDDIRKAVPLLSSPKVDDFIARYKLNAGGSNNASSTS